MQLEQYGGLVYRLAGHQTAHGASAGCRACMMRLVESWKRKAVGHDAMSFCTQDCPSKDFRRQWCLHDGNVQLRESGHPWKSLQRRQTRTRLSFTLHMHLSSPLLSSRLVSSRLVFSPLTPPPLPIPDDDRLLRLPHTHISRANTCVGEFLEAKQLSKMPYRQPSCISTT